MSSESGVDDRSSARVPPEAVPPRTTQAAADENRSDLVDELRELAALRDRGVLTEAEFTRAKLLVVEQLGARRASP